jgi:serine/threonine protein kinase/Flp pilus assembly protein TadD
MNAMLPERYQAVRVLGKGGWGDVHLALDQTTGAQVAVKRISLSSDLGKSIAEKEIQALSSLDHPYIVKLLDAFSSDGSFCIVTEYIAGHNLEEICERRTPTLTEVRKYALQIVEALDYIHGNGIIHSDLKPANIIIDADDNVRLIDFGIVRTASAEIASDIKDVRGTLHYLSPEQAEGKPYDVRSDLFSFGVVLYELCTGKKPFTGDYDMAVMYAILYEDPVRPDRINNSLSAALSSVIENLLAKNPDQRPASAAQVKEDLEKAFAEPDRHADVTVRRVAVLPLDFPKEDKSSQLIAEGLREELYDRLKKIPVIDVVSPIKINQHAANLVDGSAVRTLLGADHYLSGNILKSEHRIRIYLKLFSSMNDSVAWAYRYDNPMSDLFDVIDLITENVMAGLQVQLSVQPDHPPRPSPRPDVDAFELYLRGRDYYVKNTRRDIEYARNMYVEALKLYPDYSLAMVGLADCYCLDFMNYFNRTDEAIAIAKGHAEHALRVSANLPEAYRALGRIMHATGNYKSAGLYYLKAVTYKEDYFQAHRSLGWLSKDCFKYEEALQWVRKALSVNSTDVETIFLKGIIQLETKDSKAAANDFTRCLELRPDYGRAHFYLGMTYFQMGRVPQAIAAMEKAVLLGGDINAPYLLGYYHIVQHDFAHAIPILHDAALNHEIAFMAHFYLGLTSTLQEDRPGAREHFEKALALSEGLIYDNPDMAIAKAVKATALAFLGRTDECAAVIRELIPYAVYDGSTTHDLARIYAVLGDRENTERYVKSAVETPLGPSEAEIRLDPIITRHWKRERR